MEQSQEINELTKALSVVQGNLKSARKDAENPFFHSRYADLSTVWEVCRKPLSENGLAVIQVNDVWGESIVLETMLTHTSGQWVRGRLLISPAKVDPQGIGSAMTYARRYALSALLGIVADEDDDGEAAMGRVKDKPKSESREHWCTEHNCAFTEKTNKDGAKWYSHKTSDGKWCNERKAEKEEPLNMTEKEVADLFGPEKEEVSEAADGRAALLELVFKNAGEFKSACLKHFSLQPSQVDAEVPEYDLSKQEQRKKAWAQIVGVYFKG